MKHHLHFLFFLLPVLTASAGNAQVTKLSNNSNMLYGLPVNGKFLMVAKNGALWSTDGTAANTKEFTTKATYNDTGGVAIINNKLYFSGTNTAGGTELWVTDGTDAGTSIVKDINPGAASSHPDNFNVINNVIYFSADDGTHGNELWKSDGTAGGTVMVKDINPGAGESMDSATWFVNNNTLFFTPNDGTHGTELWVSDGSSAGTKLLKEIVAGNTGPGFDGFTSLGTKTVFEVSVGAILTGNEELWATDGTSGGTVLLKDFGTFSAFPSLGFTKFDNKIYFSATAFTTTGTELWVTDGTAGGTSLFKDIDPGINGSNPVLFGSTVFSNKFMFSASTAAKGNELWICDGTSAGTSMLKDINPGAGSSNPFAFNTYTNLGINTSKLYQGKIFVSADDGTHGRELWITDGTVANTGIVKDIQAGSGGSLSGTTTYFYTGSGLFFGANDGIHGMELWKSDGTGTGTTMVADINPGSGASSPKIMGIYNNHIYFTADDGDNGAGNTDLFIVNEATTELAASLSSFTATPLKGDVALNWATAEEINTGFFTIQRSSDGRQFEDIGTVQAAGNSTNNRQYSFIDLNALRVNASILYYRLQTNDKDGKQSYSGIVAVKTNGEAISIKAYPNPASGFVILNYNLQNSTQGMLRITDASGKIVISRQLGNTQNNMQTSVDIKALPAGVYYVQLTGDKGTQTAKFIKQP
ncbi:MAG TPA: ELWxxDGT repeat protein [Chitinophagaceae bacterium]|nr:ELWxxDGT repeat protein [Chitinophagaceae bacterium]